MATMDRAAKVAVGVSGVIVAGLIAFAVVPLLTGPSTTEPSAAAPRTAPTHSPVPDTEPVIQNASNGGNLPEGCTQWSAIRFAPSPEGATTTTVGLEGPALIDTGATELAGGPVTLDDEGRIATYTVEEGDAPAAIGARFCVDYVTVLQFNHTWPIVHPGTVLSLAVDPAVPFTLEP